MSDDLDNDPMDDLSGWDLLVVRWSMWWFGLWHRFRWACDVIHRPWSRAHRSCRCGLSRTAEWTDEDRAAFGQIVEAAKRINEEGE